MDNLDFDDPCDNCSWTAENESSYSNESNMDMDWLNQQLINKYAQNRKVDDAMFLRLLIIYVILIFIGSVGNSLVILAVMKSPSMRTPRNLFILNLAVSDLLLCTVTMPFTFMELVMKYWTLGEIMCKLVASLRATSIFVSTFSITAIALDRYYIIVYPTRQSLDIRGVVICLVIIWVVAGLLATPLYIFTILETHALPITLLELLQISAIAYCFENWPIEQGRFYYSIFSVIVQYLIPILTVAIAYVNIYRRLSKRQISRKKNDSRNRKTTILLFSISVIFCISWAPLNTLNIYLDIHNPFDDETLVLVFGTCHLIGMSSACSNPLLYGWLNDNFKKEFIKICCCFKLRNKSFNRRSSRTTQFSEGRFKTINIELGSSNMLDNGKIVVNQTNTTVIS